MEKIAVSLWNREAECYELEHIFLFHSKDEAFVMLSRSIRDEFILGHVTVDWLKWHTYEQVGIWNSITGNMINNDDCDMSAEAEESFYIPFFMDCYKICKDLIEGEKNDFENDSKREEVQ